MNCPTGTGTSIQQFNRTGWQHLLLEQHISIITSITIRYDTIEEFNVDSKAKYSALSSTRSQKKKLKQTTLMPGCTKNNFEHPSFEMAIHGHHQRVTWGQQAEQLSCVTLPYNTISDICSISVDKKAAVVCTFSTLYSTEMYCSYRHYCSNIHCRMSGPNCCLYNLTKSTLQNKLLTELINTRYHGVLKIVTF